VGQPTTCMSLWQPGRYLNTVACHTRQARQDSCLTGQQPAHGMVEWRVGDLFRWCHSPLAGAIGANSPKSDCLGIKPRWRCCMPHTWAPHRHSRQENLLWGQAHHLQASSPQVTGAACTGSCTRHLSHKTGKRRQLSCRPGSWGWRGDPARPSPHGSPSTSCPF
jgi:hypothetical protein